MGLPERCSEAAAAEDRHDQRLGQAEPGPGAAGLARVVDNYVDWLNARGVQAHRAIVTKMKFDPDAAFPKIFFASERPLDA
jgi:hypothetical protein